MAPTSLNFASGVPFARAYVTDDLEKRPLPVMRLARGAWKNSEHMRVRVVWRSIGAHTAIVRGFRTGPRYTRG